MAQSLSSRHLLRFLDSTKENKFPSKENILKPSSYSEMYLNFSPLFFKNPKIILTEKYKIMK